MNHAGRKKMKLRDARAEKIRNWILGTSLHLAGDPSNNRRYGIGEVVLKAPEDIKEIISTFTANDLDYYRQDLVQATIASCLSSQRFPSDYGNTLTRKCTLQLNEGN